MTTLHDNFKKMAFKNLGEDPECPICYNGLKYEESGFLRCSHVLCTECYKCLSNDSCPMCREPLTDRKMEMMEEEICELVDSTRVMRKEIDRLNREVRNLRKRDRYSPVFYSLPYNPDMEVPPLNL